MATASTTIGSAILCHIGVNPSADPDGDGFGNLQNSLVGTDPTTPASYFHITSVASTGNNVAIMWVTESARPRVAAGSGGSYATNGYIDIFTVTNTVTTTTNYVRRGRRDEQAGAVLPGATGAVVPRSAFL